MESYKSKKQQIIDLCDALEFPIIFPDDVEQHENRLVFKRSDGYTMTYSIEIKPKLINDNSMIELDVKLKGSGYKSNLNTSF